MEEIYNYLTELAQIKDSFLTLINCGFKKPEEMPACRERATAQYERAWEILNGQKSPESIMQWESKVVYGIIPEALLKADMDDRMGTIKMILRCYLEKFRHLTQEYLLDALYFQGYDDVQLLTRTKKNIDRAVVFLPKLETVATDFGVPFAKLAEEMGYDPDELLYDPQEYGEHDKEGKANKEQIQPHLLIKQRVFAMKLLLKQAGISTKTTSAIKIATFVNDILGLSPGKNPQDTNTYKYLSESCDFTVKDYQSLVPLFAGVGLNAISNTLKNTIEDIDN